MAGTYGASNCYYQHTSYEEAILESNLIEDGDKLCSVTFHHYRSIISSYYNNFRGRYHNYDVNIY